MSRQGEAWIDRTELTMTRASCASPLATSRSNRRKTATRRGSLQAPARRPGASGSGHGGRQRNAGRGQGGAVIKGLRVTGAASARFARSPRTCAGPTPPRNTWPRARVPRHPVRRKWPEHRAFSTTDLEVQPQDAEETRKNRGGRVLPARRVARRVARSSIWAGCRVWSPRRISRTRASGARRPPAPAGGDGQGSRIEENGNVTLSMKASRRSWVAVPARYGASVVRAAAARVTDFGMFVELLPAWTGCLPRARFTERQAR